MVSWPEPGTRVMVRYRRPVGSVPPLTDAVGHLLDVTPLVRVQTKTGAVVQFAPEDAVALRTLSDRPVRASEIRALEHAAASAWPGVEHYWLDGWLLRAGHGVTRAANSAVPLDFSANQFAMPAIADWYRRRGLTPRLAIPDRLLRLSDTGEQPNWMLVRDVQTADHDPSVQLSTHPDDEWLRHYDNSIPVDLLTAVVDGELAFGRLADTATARASVTNAPDGTRWVGVSKVRAVDSHAGRELCEALLAWGAARGATRGYIRITDGDRDAAALTRSLGFALHHRARYVTVTAESVT
jgi:hypothetical protein